MYAFIIIIIIIIFFLFFLFLLVLASSRISSILETIYMCNPCSLVTPSHIVIFVQCLDHTSEG